MSQLAEEFERIRKAMGLRQSDIADLLGVRQATVSRWETGASQIDARTMIALKALQAQRAAA